MFLFHQGSSQWCPYLYGCGVTHGGMTTLQKKGVSPTAMDYDCPQLLCGDEESEVFSGWNFKLETYIFFYSSFCDFDCFEHIYLCPLLLFCWLIPLLLCWLTLRWVPSHTATIHAMNASLLCFHPPKYWVPGVRHFHFQYFYFQYFHFQYFFLINFSHLLFMLISHSRNPQTALL